MSDMSHSNRRTVRGVCTLIVGLLVSFASFPTYADLLIHPTRLVFEEGQRATKLELINRGEEAATYRLQMVNRRMNEFGEFLPAEPPLPEEKFANDLVRYSPRQVTIAPGQSQTVRLAVRKPADLASGEYRSHLLVEQQPTTTDANSIEQLTNESNDDIRVRLETLVGVTLPVIVRHGEVNAEVSFGNLQLEYPNTDVAFIRVDIVRKGNRSVYGDITVTIDADLGADAEKIIARARGVAVYYPNGLRIARFAVPAGLQPLRSGSKIRVRYASPVERGEEIFAEAELTIP